MYVVIDPRNVSDGIIMSLAGASTSLAAASSTLGLLWGENSAMARAKEAAARIPSPPPEATRKVKRKKVAWRADEEIQQFRWFRKVIFTLKQLCTFNFKTYGISLQTERDYQIMSY